MGVKRKSMPYQLKSKLIYINTMKLWSYSIFHGNSFTMIEVAQDMYNTNNDCDSIIAQQRSVFKYFWGD